MKLKRKQGGAIDFIALLLIVAVLAAGAGVYVLTTQSDEDASSQSDTDQKDSDEQPEPAEDLMTELINTDIDVVVPDDWQTLSDEGVFFNVDFPSEWENTGFGFDVNIDGVESTGTTVGTPISFSTTEENPIEPTAVSVGSQRGGPYTDINGYISHSIQGYESFGLDPSTVERSLETINGVQWLVEVYPADEGDTSISYLFYLDDTNGLATISIIETGNEDFDVRGTLRQMASSVQPL